MHASALFREFSSGIYAKNESGVVEGGGMDWVSMSVSENFLDVD
jgi:hypothetical protein